MNKAKLIGMLLVVLGMVNLFAAPKLNVFTRRYYQQFGGINSDGRTADVLKNMKVAAEIGYNAVLYDDAHLPNLVMPNTASARRLKSMKAEANRLGMIFTPCSFGQGEPTKADPTNGEAFPVDSKFKVAGGVASIVAEPAIQFSNGGFETWSNEIPGREIPGNWTLRGLGPAQVSRDPAGKTGSCLKVTVNNNRNAMIQQVFKLRKFAAYRVSYWVKVGSGINTTRGIGIEVRGDGKVYLSKIRGDRYSKATTSWKRVHWDFNTLHCTSIEVRLCAAGYNATTGTVYMDDASIEEIGLLDRQTRATTPVTVSFGDGRKTALMEGKDYQIGDGKLTIPAVSQIKDGDLLNVKWYQIAKVETRMPPSSYCHQAPWDFLEMRTRQLVDIMGGTAPKTWFFKPSEWRIAFWDQACIQQYPNAGAYIGTVGRKCTNVMKAYNSNVETYLWNDDYDYYHNAHPGYGYPVNGDFLNSADYLDPSTIIMNWVPTNRAYKSLLYFAGKDPDHKIKTPLRQIVLSWGPGLSDWLAAIDKFETEHGAASKDFVVGVLHCGYGTDPQSPENLSGTANQCKEAGRWGTGPIPVGPVSINEKSATSKNVKPVIASISSGKIRYTLSHTTNVKIDILNAQGQTVRSMAGDGQTAGTHEIEWNRDLLSAGIYFVNLTAGAGADQKVASRKVAVF